jgi:glycosyltransferase involved in cell wall biosynthesis
VTSKAKAVGRMLWSRSSASGMRAVAERFRPDVVHLHNVYHQLSPSILRPLRDLGVPIVMTAHDYKLVCPTYQLLDHGQPCEACIGRRFHHAPLRRCKDDSFGASLVAAVELSLHTALHAYAPIRAFICPSRFMEDKLRAGGVYPERLRWVPHFIDTTGIETTSRAGGGVVFAGRLAPEKGIDVVVRAVAELPDARLDIAGDGPSRAELETLAQQVAPGRVRFHGRLAKADVHRLLRESAVAVLPARWYENQPMAILEAFACGVPVVGSTLGGIPELIDPGVDGTLAPPNDPHAWAGALRPFLEDPPSAVEMGRRARAKVEEHFSPAAHLARLDEIYRAVLAGGRAPIAATHE